MDELSPLEKFNKSIGKDESLFVNGFFPNWLFTYVAKIVDKSKDSPFDFDKLHKTHDEISYDYNYPKFKEFLQKELAKEKPRKIYYIVLDFLFPRYIVGSTLMAMSYII